MEGLRIAIIGSRHPLSNYGGVERSMAALLPHLAARGHSVTVFGGPLPGRPTGTRETWQGVELAALPALPGKHSETLSRSLVAVLRAASEGFDLVHFQHQGPGVLCPLARLLGMSTVVTVNGLDWQRQKWAPPAKAAIRLAERVAVRWADRMIVPSAKLQRYFADTHQRITARIPFGIHHRPPVTEATRIRALGLEPGGYVLFAARLVPEKNCHDLIAAWNQVETTTPLVVAGAGRYDQGYVDRLHSLAQPGKVMFVGHQEGAALEQLFAHCALFVLPSSIEGLSVALLEALAHGRPVLVSDIAENAELVDGIGATFPVGDVHRLRDTLARLLADPSALAHMAQVARGAMADLPSWGQVAERYEQVYAEALRRSQRTRPGMVLD